MILKCEAFALQTFVKPSLDGSRHGCSIDPDSSAVPSAACLSIQILKISCSMLHHLVLSDIKLGWQGAACKIEL